jgi:hypothetical protein
MARTRGSSDRFHQDDGILLGKGGVPIPTRPVTSQMLPQPVAYEPGERVPLDRQGVPISPAAARLPSQVMSLSGSTVLRGPGAEPVPVASPVTGYRSDRKSWAGNMEPIELAKLIDLAFAGKGELGDGFVVEVTVEEFAKMDGNLRRHFMPVRGA